MAFNFVTPETVRLPLAGDDGDWIEVKRELTAGEAKAMRTSAFTYMAGKPEGAPQTQDNEGDVKIGVDWKKLGLANILTYVTDWNAKDAQGRPVRFCREAVEQLSEADFGRIEQALTAHKEAVEAEKKMTKAGPTPSAQS